MNFPTITCNECGNDVNYLFDDGKCHECTQMTYEEVTGSIESTEEDDMNTVIKSESKSKFLFATSEQELCDMADELIALWPEDMEGEWLTDSLDRNLEMMASRPIGVLEGQMNWLNGAISKAKVTLERNINSSDGTEISEQKLMRSTRWLNQVKGQKEFVEQHWGTEDDLLAAKLAYKGYFGKTWMPYSASQSVNKDKKLTAAAADARKALQA